MYFNDIWYDENFIYSFFLQIIINYTHTFGVKESLPAAKRKSVGMVQILLTQGYVLLIILHFNNKLM